jgi:hypothetical protein
VFAAAFPVCRAEARVADNEVSKDLAEGWEAAVKSGPAPEDLSDEELLQAVHDALAVINEYDVADNDSNQWPLRVAAWWEALMEECKRRWPGWEPLGR